MRSFNKGLLCIAAACGCSTAALADDILIAGAANADWINEVRTTLIATGLLGGHTLSVADLRTSTPSLSGYDAVLSFTDGSPIDPNAWGNALADFVDAGGGVVQSTFSWNVGPGGRWFSGGYSPFTTAGQAQGTPLTLGTVHNPSHPVMAGVTNFNGGQSSYHNTGTVASGADLIADWSNARPLVAEMPGFAAAIIGLNFYPPSNLSRADFWESSTDGGVMMANALNYVLGAAGSFRLRITGPCPGTLTITWSNATPNRSMGIVFARNQGAFVVPGGPCAGTALGLGTQNLRLVNTISTGSGSGSVNGLAGTSACGGYLQLVVVDASPCTTSNVAQIP